ncbi:unnamed protein product [Mytilus edulis]|uniref:Endonuclease/exonuclease/phosphatase domain-containing protein n=1 Tax=Mytilus edulis TaxID=6550 RepID=A0A8S3RPC5_MYTED|nr:unnamed protein product [Mytilus edulis]
MEEELKKEKVIINDAIKDQSHLKSYSLNLEAKVKELENSNRILRMKIVGTQPLDVSSSTTGQKPSNTQDNGPSSCANGHTSNFANGHASNFNTHISTLENNIISDRITQIENTRQLYRQMHDMELQSIQQRLKNLEASLQQQSFRPEYQPCHFNPFSMQHPTSLGSTYMTRMPSHLPHHRPMHPYWPGSPQLVPTHQPYLHRPLQSQIPPHVWNIPPLNYQYRQQTTDTSNKQHSTHQNLQGANLQYGQESVKNIDSSTQHKLDHSTPSSHIMNQEISIQTKPYTEKTSSSLDKEVTITLNKIEQEKTISEAQLPQILQTDSKKESYILVPNLPKPICIIDDSDMEEVQPQGEATRSDTHLLDNNIKFEQENIGDLFSKTSWTCKSVDENNPIPPTQRPRGYGGVAILWKQSMDHLVEKIEDGSERIICIKLKVKPKPILLICAYMPCNGSKQAKTHFKECLDQLHEIITKYSDTCTPVLCGDWNCDLMKSSKKPARSIWMEEFINSKKLAFKPTPLTFIHPNGNESSTIDYIFVHSNLADKVNNTIRLDMLPNNTSDHYPLLTEIEIEMDSGKEKDKNFTSNKIKWDKIDLLQYQESCIAYRNDRNEFVPPPPTSFSSPPPWMSDLINKIDNLNLRMNSVDEIKSSVISIDSKLTKMGSVVDGLVKRVEVVENSQQFISAGFEQNKSDMAVIADDITSLRVVNRSMVDQLEQLQCENLRDNLMFFGIEEVEGEDCIDCIRSICALSLEIREPIEIASAFRMEKKFVSKSTRIVPIHEKRKLLFPVYKKAKEAGKRVSFNKDKLFIDGEQTVVKSNELVKITRHDQSGDRMSDTSSGPGFSVAKKTHSVSSIKPSKSSVSDGSSSGSRFEVLADMHTGPD